MTATSANPSLVRHHRDDLKLFRSRSAKIALGALVIAFGVAPLHLTTFQVSVGVFAGVAAIGALGLNLLTGYTGQVSLGHAAFLGIGAYTGAYVGGDLELPFVAWVVAAGLAGAAVGGVIGPFALRLRGSYLAIITLGLVFLAKHVFENWTSVTGGLNGRAVEAPVAIGPIDFAELSVLGVQLTRDHGYLVLVWGVVALAALAAKNIARSRPGRAMQAVRDRDLAAEAVGVNLARTKVMAFVLSSALAAVAGSLSASYNRFVSPGEFTLVLSIIYVAIIVVGGVGTTFGPIIGAVFITAIPRVIETYSDRIPFVATDAGSDGIITVFSLNQAIFGLLIISFLVFEPRGLAAIWLRLRAYFRSWPFSY